MKFAAILVVLLSITGLVFLSNDSNNTFADHLVETNFNTTDILIYTPDNKYYKVSNNDDEQWLDESGVSISVTPQAISFKAANNATLKENTEYKIIVPNQKKYHLNLIDKTSIELNSNTVIVFSNSTTSEQRKLELDGEAFFDVTHNKSRPFIVQSSDLKIEVLGTEFNVSNYHKNGYTNTTLIDGSINVSNQQGENKVIKPGHQATLYHNQSAIDVKEINVQQAVSWTVNRMIFEDETLENIIQKLNKWYDVTFIMNDDNIKQYRFTGTLKKENELTHFLQMLKYTEGISYKVNKDEVMLFFE